MLNDQKQDDAQMNSSIGNEIPITAALDWANHSREDLDVWRCGNPSLKRNDVPVLYMRKKHTQRPLSSLDGCNTAGLLEHAVVNAVRFVQILEEGEEKRRLLNQGCNHW